MVDLPLPTMQRLHTRIPSPQIPFPTQATIIQVTRMVIGHQSQRTYQVHEAAMQMHLHHCHHVVGRDCRHHAFSVDVVFVVHLG